MKKTTALLPLICGISLLQACSTPGHAEKSEIRVEPVVSIRNSDNSPESLYKLGQYHYRQHQFDQAADAYRRALAQNPDYVDARNGLASVFSSENRFDEALAEFHAILQKNPTLSYVHNNLGYTYFLKKDYPSAVAELGTAIALDPANARAFGNLALVYEQLGDPIKADAALLRAAALKPAAAAQPASASAAASAPASAPAAAAAAVMPPSSPAPAPGAAGNGIAVEIANGTRNASLADTTTDALRRDGFTVSRVTQLRPFTQHRTVILYRDGFRQQAIELSHSFAVPPAIVNNTHTRRPSDKSSVRLVLGKATLTQAMRTAHPDDADRARERPVGLAEAKQQNP